MNQEIINRLGDGFNFDIHFYSAAGKLELVEYIEYYAKRQNSSLLEALKECEAYFDDRADTLDDEFQMPNTEMRMLIMIREVLKKVEK